LFPEARVPGKDKPRYVYIKRNRHSGIVPQQKRFQEGAAGSARFQQRKNAGTSRTDKGGDLLTKPALWSIVDLFNNPLDY
jgi:hypothetical protein